MRLARHRVTTAVFSLAALLAIASCSDKATNPGSGSVPKVLDSGSIPPGGVFTHTFASVGNFHYHCTIHGTGMAGQVIVVDGSADSALVTIADNNYSPTPASVKPGGTVRWINNGSTHTVTSN